MFIKVCFLWDSGSCMSFLFVYSFFSIRATYVSIKLFICKNEITETGTSLALHIDQCWLESSVESFTASCWKVKAWSAEFCSFLKENATGFNMFYIYVYLILLLSIWLHYPQSYMKLHVWKSFQSREWTFCM